MEVKRQISHISVVQTAKVFGVFSLIASIPFWILAAIPVIAMPGPRPAFFGSFIFLMPILYAASSFIVIAVAACLYNVLVKFTGGIEFTSEEVRGGDA
jgi:predicted transporter